MEPHDITSYPLKLPFIRSSKMAKRDAIGCEFQTEEDERYVRPSQSNDNYLRRSQAAALHRGYGGLNARAPIEIQLDNFRRKAIEMGITGPAYPHYGSQPAALPECNPAMLRSDFYAPPPDLGPPLFPLVRPSSQQFEEGGRREETYQWPDRFRMAPASQPCSSLAGCASGRSNLDHTGAPPISERFGAPFDFSLADEDSPPFARSQLPQRPFPLAGEPSAMFGALPHDAGFTQAALPPHCRWTAAPAPKRRAPRGDYRNQRNFMPSSKMFETRTVSPPARPTNFSLDTTGFASPQPVTAADRLGALPPRRPHLAGHKRRATSASHLPVKKKFKSGPATSPLYWDSDAEYSPEHQSDPILDRGLLALSPIAKSTPCPVIRHDPRSIKPPDRPPSSSAASSASASPSRPPQRPLMQQKGVQTSKKLGGAFIGVNAAAQTDMSTNMPIFRETACSPFAWRRCPSCGCHREAPGPAASPAATPPQDADRPACHSVSSADTEAASFLNDFLIGVAREE